MLHEVVGSCVINVFDTSAVETLKGQLGRFKAAVGSVEGSRKAIADCNQVRSWSINDTLSRYKASHGVNVFKEKFQQYWREGKGWFFQKRPMDGEYRQYCIFDVLDLPEVREKMVEGMSAWEERLGAWVSAHYAAYGY